MIAAHTIRTVARKLIGSRMASYLREHSRRVLPTICEYRTRLRGTRGLEIGGPSEIFGPNGFVPVYEILESLDNCLYSARTIWAGGVQEGNTFHYYPHKPPGGQMICEATCLLSPSSSYDCVLASHCLEHLANPLLGLSEWQRVLREEGVLLLILPHKDGTFDWHRPTTTLAHLVADYENEVGEDDLTHLPEVLALHDLERDKLAGTMEQFRQRCLDNFTHRAMHHHVFDTLTAIQLVDRAGFTITRVDHLRPFHIIILARRDSGMIDNRLFLDGGFDLQRSPFPSDRRPS
jgi:SAM-dependent methyltransferase